MVALYKVCSNHAPGVKIGPTLWVTCFNNISSEFEKGCGQLKNMAIRGCKFPYTAIAKHCENSRSRIFCPIFMKLAQYICSNDIPAKFENGFGNITKVAQNRSVPQSLRWAAYGPLVVILCHHWFRFTMSDDIRYVHRITFFMLLSLN